MYLIRDSYLEYIKAPTTQQQKPHIFNQKMVKGLKDKFLQGRYTHGHAYMLSHFCHVWLFVILWTEDPGGLQPRGSQNVWHDLVSKPQQPQQHWRLSGLRFILNIVTQVISFQIFGTHVPSLGWPNSLEKGVVSHSSILPWRSPWMEEPDGVQSMGFGKSWTPQSDYE